MKITIKWTNDGDPKPKVYYSRKDGSIGGRLTKKDVMSLVSAGVITDPEVIAWLAKPRVPKVLVPKAPKLSDTRTRNTVDDGLKGYDLYKYLDSLYGKVKPIPSVSPNNSLRL